MRGNSSIMAADPWTTTMWDTLIVGSGPLGCTFFRKLYDGHIGKILMIDAGAKLSERPGWHLKNSYLYQRNVNDFTGVISGHLHTLSIPPDKSNVPTLDPGAFQVDYTKYKGFISNNANPEQSAYDNLPSAAATYAVGGMATHWTACTPRQTRAEETQWTGLIDSASEWDGLYKEAEELLNTTQNMFDDTKDESYAGKKEMPSKFVRNQIVLKTLQDTYTHTRGNNPHSKPQYLPLAGKRRPEMPQFIEWSGADTVLGDVIIKKLGSEATDKFVLKEMWQCCKLIPTTDGNSIGSAEVRELLTGKIHKIKAKRFIICAGAVLTPQILHNSGLKELKALGHYMCEQPLAFCQVVLLQSLIEKYCPKDNGKSTNKDDPIPFPDNDPQPQCWIPVSDNYPWHCQIHRDAFSYGGVAPNVDERLVVDLRWFGKVEPNKENRVEFSENSKNKDSFDMPQPTFHFKLSEKDSQRAHDMMEDMLKAAGSLGGFLPGSEPSFQLPGLALHITGTCRMGKKPEDSVVDKNSKVWGYTNLYLGSCGVIPIGIACNPTLTAMAVAIKSCESITDKPSSPAKV